MRKIIAITAILTASALNMAVAADGVMPAALPGPYRFIVIPQQNYVQPTPYVAPQVQNVPQTQLREQPYWMQAPNQQLVPYWMQGPQRQPAPFMNANPNVVPYGSQGNAATNTQAGGQVQGGFDFNAQARSNNTFSQGYGLSAGPGYFPGYGSGQQATQNVVPQINAALAPQQPAPNFQGYQPVPYQQQGLNMPWNGNWNGPWGGQSFGPWGSGVPTGYGSPTGWGR
jgi:hypothetical protein